MPPGDRHAPRGPSREPTQCQFGDGNVLTTPQGPPHAGTPLPGGLRGRRPHSPWQRKRPGPAAGRRPCWPRRRPPRHRRPGSAAAGHSRCCPDPWGEGQSREPPPPGPGARSSPHVCRPAGRSGPRGPAGSSAPVAAPAPSRLPSVPLSGAGVSSRRRGHTWDSVLVPVLAPTPPQKARGGSSLADLPAQPARARRTRAPSPRAPRGYVQGAPQVLERGSLLGGRGAARALGHPPRTAPQGPLAL